MKIFLIILFYLIYALVSFALVYSADIADIAEDDFKPYEPSINDLSEEEKANKYTINDYIKNTICPRYYHQKIKNEIDYYQSRDTSISLCTFVIIVFSCMIPAKSFITYEFIGSYVLSYLTALIIGVICYCVVWMIYKNYRRCSTVRIKHYYDIYSSYDWYSHYNYLLRIKENVVFRYMLRKIFTFLTFSFCFLISVLMYECV